MRVDIAIICATWISRRMSSGQKSEVWISDPAVLNHTHAFLNRMTLRRSTSASRTLFEVRSRHVAKRGGQ